MQYKVPQNVDMEDKVIGALTIRQFMILLIAGAIILVLNFIFIGVLRIFFWLFAIIISGLAGIVGFVKYGDQNFETFLLSALQTLTNPRKRVWKKTEEIPQTIMKAPEKKPEVSAAAKKPIAEERDDLNKLAELVDSGGFVSIEKKDRNIGFADASKVEKIAAPEATDALEQIGDNNNQIENALEAAEKKIPKREALISEQATIKPNKAFDYQQIETKK